MNIEHSRVFQLRKKKIKKYPVSVVLPQDFIRANRIKVGDELIFYLVENTHELIIKKKEDF